MSQSESDSLTQSIIGTHDRCMINNVARYPIAMVRGQGSRLWDAAGKEYLDLFAGFGGPILGHCHPDLVDAITRQAGTLWHVGNLFHTQPQTELAAAIHDHGFGGQSFFSHCGSDANEAAIKLARLWGKAHPGHAGYKYKVITAHHSFHGRLFASMMATAQDKVRKGFEPLLDGFGYVPYNDLPAMTAAVDDRTVAIMVEPIQGEGGIIVPDDTYLAGLRKLCDERGMLLIFDEVWTGCGRTGKWFGYQHWDVTPDIMTLAKGVGGGLAVGVMCAAPPVAHLFTPAGNHGVAAHVTTLGGNCLGMAAAATLFNVIQRDHLLDHATAMGQHITRRLEYAATHLPILQQVRGKGLFIGAQIDSAGNPARLMRIVNQCLQRGVLLNGTQDNVVRLAPALTITQAQIDQGLDVLLDVLGQAG